MNRYALVCPLFVVFLFFFFQAGHPCVSFLKLTLTLARWAVLALLCYCVLSISSCRFVGHSDWYVFCLTCCSLSSAFSVLCGGQPLVRSVLSRYFWLVLSLVLCFLSSFCDHYVTYLSSCLFLSIDRWCWWEVKRGEGGTVSGPQFFSALPWCCQETVLRLWDCQWSTVETSLVVFSFARPCLSFVCLPGS